MKTNAVINPELNPTNELIESLSQKFALNYLANSFNRVASGHIDSNNIFEQSNNIIFKDNSFDKDNLIGDKKIRNVLIIGAGAIFNSFNGIPMGAEIKNRLIESKFPWLKEIENGKLKIEKLDFIKKKIYEEYYNLTLLTENDDLSFENLLFLLSKFMTEEELRKEIKKVVGFQNGNNLFYDIVAHLFKHSFIDVIINFNFEEILDNVIREELGEGNYYSIISDGHTVKRENLFVEGRIKFPVYIKPHGTYSHSSSLRFTNQHYLDSPPDIKLMLSEIFLPYNNEKLNLNIICVGFKLFESIEFKNILKNSLDKVTNPCFYIITNSAQKDKQIEEINKNIFYNTQSKINESNVYTCSLKEFESSITDNNISPSLGILFSIIFRRTTNKFNINFTPRSIAKHEVYSYFLYNKNKWLKELDRKKIDEYYESSDYFKDKILIEIAFTFVRNLGLINIIDLLKSRVGIYLNYYNEKFRYENKNESIETIYSLISEFSELGSSEDLFNFGEEKEYQFSKNYFKLPIIKDVSSLKNIFREIERSFNSITDNKRKKFIEQLANLLRSEKNKITLGKTALLYLLRSDKLSVQCKYNLVENCILSVNSGAISHPNNFVDELFRLFQKSPNQNFFFIRNRINNNQYHYWESFSKNKLLQTNLSISYNFHQIFLEDKWNTLLAVLESGMVIKDCLIDKFNKFNKNSKDFFNWFKEKRILITLSYQVAQELISLHELDSTTQKNQSNQKSESTNAIFELERKFKEFLMKDILENNMDETKEHYKKIFSTNIGIIFLPYWEHNHHVSLFLNFKDTLLNEDKQVILKSKKNGDIKINVFGGFHMYRKGNSNSINPIHIKFENHPEDNKIISRDFEKLFLLYFLNVCRGIMFQLQIDLTLCYNKHFIVKGLTTYKDWSSEEFYSQMVDFFYNIKKFELDLQLEDFYTLK